MLRLALRLTLLLLCALLPGRAWAAVGAPSEHRVTGEAAEKRVKGLEAPLVYCTYRATLATPRQHLGNEPALRENASAPLFRWKGRWWSDFGGPDGTYDMRARVWSPELGIFLSADAFAYHDARGTLWSWPNQNPVNLSDPSGNLGENNGAGTLPWFLRGIEGLNNFDMGVRTRAQGIDLMHNESTFELGLSFYACGSAQMGLGMTQTITSAGDLLMAVNLASGVLKAGATMGAGRANLMRGGGGRGGGPMKLYHGTDRQSALGLLNGEPLDASTAAAGKLDGPPGFFLATERDAAVYFALRRSPGAVIEYQLSGAARAELGAAGSVLRPIPAGGMAGGFPGQEYFIPNSAFDTFNRLFSAGHITVGP